MLVCLPSILPNEIGVASHFDQPFVPSRLYEIPEKMVR